MNKLADIGVSTFLIRKLDVMTEKYGYEFTVGQFTLLHSFLLVVAVLLLDCLFMVVLCVGLYKNSVNWLRIFFYYSMFMAGTCSSVLMGACVYRATHLMSFDQHTLYTIAAVCACINIPMDVFMIAILLCKIVHIQNKQEHALKKIPEISYKNENIRKDYFIHLLFRYSKIMMKTKGKSMISRFGENDPLKQKAIVA